VKGWNCWLIMLAADWETIPGTICSIDAWACDWTWFLIEFLSWFWLVYWSVLGSVSQGRLTASFQASSSAAARLAAANVATKVQYLSRILLSFLYTSVRLLKEV
jgi:hypothetical protein